MSRSGFLWTLPQQVSLRVLEAVAEQEPVETRQEDRVSVRHRPRDAMDPFLLRPTRTADCKASTLMVERTMSSTREMSIGCSGQRVAEWWFRSLRVVVPIRTRCTQEDTLTWMDATMTLPGRIGA